jgi:hemoglobin
VTSTFDERQIYAELGEEGFATLVAGFYRRVKEDDLIGPMYPEDDWEGSEQRLRDFLIFRFGGPRRYIEERGHPMLRRRHFPFAVDSEASKRWVALMNGALEETPMPDEIRAHLSGFFAHVADFLRNRPDS